MIATAPKIANSSKALHSQLEKIKVDTGQRCTAEVSRRFLSKSENCPRAAQRTELVGIISQVNSQHRLTIVVNFLQQGASITVDEADIELI